jgi:5S rRNA maturation endonuclease (ribonuclease M5)
VNNPVDSKINKIKGRSEAGVAVLTDPDRLGNREKIDQAARDAKDAIEQVIDKATRATKEISKK